MIPASTDRSAADWRKSSYSGGGNNCVEVAKLRGAAAVRDSKNPDAGHLTFGTHAWQAFIGAIKRGEHAL